MKGLLSILVVMTFAAPAAAECFVDYKAKRDDPFQLHYGVISLEDEECEDSDTIESAIAERIAVDDWSLLDVVNVLTQDEAEEKEADAGAYFLRY